MFRRITSVLLALTMVLSVVPAQAFATETEAAEETVAQTIAMEPTEAESVPATEEPEETTAPAETEPVAETEPEEPSEPETVPAETVPADSGESEDDSFVVFSETSGTCGENVTWTLADGVLTISGTGAMEDYGWGSAPWFESRDSILHVIVESGVTRVGSNAFGVLKAVTVISLSDTVTSIGEYAFQTSQSLSKLSLPDSLETIEKYAFHGSGITQISLPDAVETLGEGLFMNCEALTTAEIGGSVTVIPKYCFSGCSGLETVSLPDGITSIQYGAFTSAAPKTIHFAGTADQWNAITIDSSNTALCNADIYCDDVLLENPVVANGYCGSSVQWNLDQSGKLTIFGSGNMYNYYEPGTTGGSSGYGSMDAPWYTLRSNVKTLEIQEGVTRVGQYAFYNLTGITEVVIPESVLTVEEDAFRNCTSLVSVEILGPVDKIYQNAFNGCTSLTTLILHDGAKQILSHALEGCTKLKNVRFPASLTSIPSGLFEDCGKITSAGPIGSGSDYEFGWTTAIPNYAFMGLKNLTKVKLPYGLEKIGTGAFMHRLPTSSGFAEIEIPDGVTEIGASAFLNCGALDTVYLPGTLQTIRERAFNGNGYLAVYYAGTEEEWQNISVSSPNDSLTSAEFVYQWYQSTYWKAIHLYSRWDEENQTVYLGDGTALYVTDSTAPAWKENPAAYLGKYMLVTAERVETEEYNGYALVNMVPLQSEMGYVTSATDKRITINLASYDVPKDLKSPQQYVGKYVVYHLLNWSLLGLEELQSCEAYLTSWDPQTKMLGLRMDKLSDTPEQFYLYSDYEDVLGWLNSWDGKETIVKIRYDSNHCVYTMESEVVDGVFSYMFEGTQRFSYSYHYDEGWFDESSSTYQHDLTRMSLRVAMAAGDTRKGNVGEPYQNIAELMNELGFDYSETHSSYPDPEYDTIGYAIGSKEITAPGGQPRTLIMVGVRGIDYCDEWGGNFRIGSGMTEHEGFNLAAEQVVAGLKKYIAANKDTFHPTIQLWISGYSRGGATTNLTAAKIIDGAIPEIQPQNVYAFCFECPRNTTDPNVRSSKYRQIVNIINPIDFVTHVAMKNLGFDRYGTDYILPNIESTGTSRYKGLRDGLYASYLDILKWGYSDSTAIRMADEYITETTGQAEIFRKASDDLAEFVKDRTYYVLKYQTFFMDAFAMVMGGSELDGLVDAADSLAGLMIATYKDAENFRDLAFWNAHFISTLINDTLKYAHMPTLCLAWLETVDTLEPGANRFHERVFINCPVDVEVYSDGELVGRIVNDVPQDIHDGILTDIDEDGQKILVLPGDGDYDIRITATDDGEMTYTVTQQDSVSGNVSRVVSYQNVEIRKNDVLSADTTSGLGVHSLKLQDGTDAVPDADLSGGEVLEYTVTVLAEGEGTVIGGGTYLRGEFAKVTAETPENVIFLGWYQDDALVSENREYRFLVEQDAVITARFAHKDECRITITQQYLAVPAGEAIQLEIETSHEILKSWIQWDVSEGDSVAAVDAQGNVMTAAQGTARIRATVSRDGVILTDQCRIDVTEPLVVEGVQLNTTKATTELYSTDYADLEILLKLPQNYTMSDSQTDVQDNGIAIDSARFTDDTLADLFHISILDDRRVQIVPTDYAVENPKLVKSKYTGTITVTIQGEEYETNALTLTVKQTKPKLKVKIAAFNSFYADQAQEIVITGGTPTAIYENAAKNTAKATAIPNWLTLEEDSLALNENAPKKSVSGKAYLLVETEEWRIPAAVTLSVKNTYKAPVLKLSAKTVTLNTATKDSPVVTVTVNPADYDISRLNFRLTDSTGKVDKTGELTVSYENGKVTIGKTDSTKGSYKLYIGAEGLKEVVLTVKTVSTKPTVTFKASGNIDLSIPGSAAAVTPTFKNYRGSFTLAEVTAQNSKKQDVTAFFTAGQNAGRILVTCADNVPTGTYTLTLKLRLADDSEITGTAKVTVKRSVIKLKLSPSRLTLNKLVGDKGSVSVTSTVAGYNLKNPVWQLMDKSGKNPAEGKLDIAFENGTLTVGTNDNTDYGTTYKLLVRANDASPASTLTVTVPAKNKSNITATLKTGGSIDVIRDNSSITLTPAYKNCGKEAVKEETLLIYSSGDNYSVPVNSLFDITRTEQGAFAISKAENADLDYRLKYKAKLVAEFDNAITVESALTSVKVSMGKAKLTVNAENPNLFVWDKHSRVEFQIAAADNTLNGLAGVRIKEAKYQELFEIHSYGNNAYAVGFAGNEVGSSLMGKKAPKNVTVTLQISLEGNVGTTANAEIKLKLNLVSAPLTTSVSIAHGDTDVTGQVLNLSAGDEVALAGIRKPDDAVGVFAWSSSNPSVAAVDPSDGVVSAKKLGTATITCTAIDGSGKSASVTGKVNPPETGFTLIFTGDWDSITAEGYQETLTEVFHTVYPRIYARIAEESQTKTVTVKADSAYEGVAYTSGDKIVISVNYANTNPSDMGFFAHELTHVAQNYGNKLNYGGDAWWTENLANYARFRYYAWASPETVKVYSKDDPSVQDWSYKPYGSCEWFFAYLDDRYPTVKDSFGKRTPGLIDALNQAVKQNQGEQLSDDPADTASLFNRIVQEITGFDCIESLRVQYARELQEGSWCFTGFGTYRDNFLTEDLPGVKNPEYPMMTEAVHGQKTAVPVSAITSGKNLCAGASVFAVSGQVNEKERAELLIDGNLRTKWCCTAATATDQRYNLDGTKQWIILDLGEEKEFNTYTIMNTKTVEPSYGNMTQWELLASNDGETWISVDYQPDCDQNSASFKIGRQSARYIMLRIYNPDDSQSGTIRLYEFMLYQQ